MPQSFANFRTLSPIYRCSDARKPYLKEILGTVYILIKVACLVKEVKKYFEYKMGISKLVSTRWSTTLRILGQDRVGV
jgi:hypothetical protein